MNISEQWIVERITTQQIQQILEQISTKFLCSVITTIYVPQGPQAQSGF